MGTGISKHFSGTKGSRSNSNLQADLFFDKVTNHMDQKQSSTIQKGDSVGQNLNSYSGGYDQGKEIPMDKNDDIFLLYIVMCNMLKSKRIENKNKKLLEFLNDFDNDGSKGSFGFQIFKKYIEHKTLGYDYGYKVIRDFIGRYFFASSDVHIKLQRDEWIAYVNKVKDNPKVIV